MAIGNPLFKPTWTLMEYSLQQGHGSSGDNLDRGFQHLTNSFKDGKDYAVCSSLSSILSPPYSLGLSLNFSVDIRHSHSLGHLSLVTLLRCVSLPSVPSSEPA